MNQKQYLRTLNRALYLYVPWEERQDILSDYREYFSDGISQGESEGEIMSRLGPPNIAAKEILSERGAFTISKRVIRKAVLFFLSMLLFALSILFFRIQMFGIPFTPFLYFHDICPVLIFLIALAHFFMRSSWRSRPKQKNKNLPFWIVSASVSLLTLLSILLLFLLVFVPAIQGTLPPYVDPSTIGPLLAYSSMGLSWIIFPVWLWLLVGTRNRSPMCQSLNFWFAGLLGLLHTGGFILAELADPDDLFTFVIWVDWLWPVGVGIVLTGAAMLASYLLSKWGRA